MSVRIQYCVLGSLNVISFFICILFSSLKDFLEYLLLYCFSFPIILSHMKCCGFTLTGSNLSENHKDP